MKVTVDKNEKTLNGVTLDLTPLDTLIILLALKTLHEDGGRNELDRIASKNMRKQILSAIKNKSKEKNND